MRKPFPARQHGVALIVALILLVLSTLIALSASRFTAMEVAQSGNFETVRDGQQSSQSVVEAIKARPETFIVSGAVPYTACTNSPGLTTGCNDTSIVLPGGLYSAEIGNGEVAGRATRLEPALKPLPRSANATSLVYFKGATFRLQGTYDKTESRGSRVTVEEGYLVPIATGV